MGIVAGFFGKTVSSEEMITKLARKIMSIYDEDKNGSLGDPEIAKIMMDLYRCINKDFTPSKYDIETYSKVLDSNYNGIVTQSDLEELIRKYIGTKVNSQMETVQQFSKTVIKKSKTLDMALAREKFNEMDLDGDGRINKFEFTRAIRANADHFKIDPELVDLEKLFEEVDKDGNGKITFEEYVEGIIRG